MARGKKATPAYVEPEDESQDLPEEEPETVEEEDEPAPGKPISKAKAVREALAQGKTSPEDGTDYIMSQYGIEMSRQMWSSYKAQMKAREAKKAASSAPLAKRGRKPKAESPAHSPVPASIDDYLAPPPKPRGNDLDLLDALTAMKPLIAQYGADRVKQMVEILA